MLIHDMASGLQETTIEAINRIRAELGYEKIETTESKPARQVKTRRQNLKKRRNKKISKESKRKNRRK